MKSKWALIALWLLPFALIAALPWLLEMAGYYLEIRPRLGEPTETRLDFDALPSADDTGSDPVPIDPAIDSEPATDSGSPAAKNVILLLGDGLGFSQLIGARYALAGPNGRLELERFPVSGWSVTHSAREIYTDSAAGATALASGVKTLPGALGIDADGQAVPTVLEMAVAAGKSAGLVTDSYFADASPSAFVAHQESRRDYVSIALSMAASGATVIHGEHRPYFEEREGWAEAMAAMEEAGFATVETADQLAALAPESRVFGRFDEASIADPERSPHLLDLAVDALDRLSTDPDGFFLFVETEETDTYSHRGDFERTVAGVAALDRVAAHMVDFARRDGETLVLATADHDTGGLGLLGGEHGEPIRVRWLTGSHTAEPVPLLAYGAGAEYFSGVHDNTEVGKLIRKVLGLPATPSSEEGDTANARDADTEDAAAGGAAE